MIGAAIALVVGAGGVYALIGRDASSTAPPAAQTKSEDVPDTVTKDGVVRFAAMGDMLAHDSIVSQARSSAGYDFAAYFAQVRPLYKDADVVFCNPETLIAGEEYGITGYPSFNAPKEFARDLVSGAGCGVINLATNHINDKGQAALSATLDTWDTQAILAKNGANRSAEEQMKVSYFTKNGVKFAFLGFADYSNNSSLTAYGLNSYHNTSLVTSLLDEARRNADAVIVSAHWGTEDSTQVNADQAAAAQLFADHGADVVIGTGPHVLQKATYLAGAEGRNTLVWYSIGNMLSSQLKIDELTGVIAGFTITKEAAGRVKVSTPTAQITYMSYDWAAADKAADRLEARSNLQLRPLSTAGSAPTDMFGAAYSKAEREAFVKTTLTAESGIIISP